MTTQTAATTDEKQSPQSLLLRLRGVGRTLWRQAGGADAYVQHMRDEFPDVAEGAAPMDLQLRCERAWQRVIEHQGAEFRTASGLAVTHVVDGTGVWFFRDGQRVNRRLSRAQFDEAVRRCPLRKTTDINDLIDYPYLFALLTDARVRGNDW